MRRFHHVGQMSGRNQFGYKRRSADNMAGMGRVAGKDRCMLGVAVFSRRIFVGKGSSWECIMLLYGIETATYRWRPVPSPSEAMSK